MIRALVVTSILAADLLVASGANAQARMTFIPSVSFGAVYDDTIADELTKNHKFRDLIEAQANS